MRNKGWIIFIDCRVLGGDYTPIIKSLFNDNDDIYNLTNTYLFSVLGYRTTFPYYRELSILYTGIVVDN